MSKHLEEFGSENKRCTVHSSVMCNDKNNFYGGWGIVTSLATMLALSWLPVYSDTASTDLFFKTLVFILRSLGQPTAQSTPASGTVAAKTNGSVTKKVVPA